MRRKEKRCLVTQIQKKCFIKRIYQKNITRKIMDFMSSSEIFLIKWYEYFSINI